MTRRLFILFNLLIASSLFATENPNQEGCNQILDVIRQHHLTLTAEQQELVDHLCQEEQNGNEVLVLLPEDMKPEEEPEKEYKPNMSVDLHGSLSGGNSELRIISGEISYKKDLGKTGAFNVSGLVEYKGTDEDNYLKTGASTGLDKLLFGTEERKAPAALFSLVKVTHDELRKVEVMANVLVGMGYDFLGDYNGGASAKYSLGAGIEYKQMEESSHPENDITKSIILTHRISLKGDLNKQISASLIAWLKQPVIVGETRDVTADIKAELRIKQLLGHEHLSGKVGVGFTYDHMPVEGNKPYDWQVEFGLTYDISTEKIGDRLRERRERRRRERAYERRSEEDTQNK